MTSAPPTMTTSRPASAPATPSSATKKSLQPSTIPPARSAVRGGDEFVERGPGPAGVDLAGGEVDTQFQGVGSSGDDQGCSCVEEHDVAVGVLHPVEETAQA